MQTPTGPMKLIPPLPSTATFLAKSRGPVQQCTIFLYRRVLHVIENAYKSQLTSQWSSCVLSQHSKGKNEVVYLDISIDPGLGQSKEAPCFASMFHINAKITVVICPDS